MQERLHGLGRRLVGGHAHRVEDLDSLADHAAAHPRRQDRLAGPGRHFADRAGRGRRVGHRQRRENHQCGVDVLVFEHRFQRAGKSLRRGVAHQVDRVAMRPAIGQELVEHFKGLRCEFRKAAAAGDQGVGGHHARSAGIGDDSQAVGAPGTLGRGRQLPGQEFGAIEHVVDLQDAFDACPLEGRLVHRIDAGHGPRMRGGGPGRFLEPPRFVGHDRLRAGKGPRRGEELAGLADRFDIQDDGTRFRRGTEVIDQVAHAHVEHVAHGDEVGKADPFIAGPIEHRRAKRPGLGDKTDLPWGRHRGGEAGIEMEPRDNDPQAVRSEDPHAVELALLLANGLFQLPSGRASLAEPGREDDDALDAFLTAGADNARHDRRRRADHRQIGDFGRALDIAAGPDSLHRLVVGIDRVDHAPVLGGNEVAKDGVADAAGRLVGPDDGDTMGIEDLVEIANAHGGERQAGCGRAQRRPTWVGRCMVGLRCARPHPTLSWGAFMGRPRDRSTIQSHRPSGIHL